MIYKISEIEDLDKFISGTISKYGNCGILFNGEYVHVIYDPIYDPIGIGNEGYFENLKEQEGEE